MDPRRESPACWSTAVVYGKPYTQQQGSVLPGWGRGRARRGWLRGPCLGRVLGTQHSRWAAHLNRMCFTVSDG